MRAKAIIRRIAPYLLAIALPLVAAALESGLSYYSKANVFIFFYAAIFILSLIAGRGPALLAIPVSFILLDYYFMKPYYTLLDFDPPEYLSLICFTLALGAIVWITTRLVSITQEKALAVKRAEDANRLKSYFIANVSHEIRTPLNIIVAFTEVIGEHLEETGDSSCAEQIEAIRRNSQRLTETIQDVIDLSKVESGSLETNPVAIRLQPFLAQRISDCEPIAQAKGIAMDAAFEEPEVAITFDEYSLDHAFLNLLQNAIKFTDKGSISVRLHRNRAGCLQLDIKDTGIGIAPEFMPHLFEPFAQEDSGYKRKREGSGLGLALTKRLLARNDAILQCASEKGAGSTFSILFPLGCELAAAVAQDVATASNGGRTTWRTGSPSQTTRNQPS